jgi:hypothetical protein
VFEDGIRKPTETVENSGDRERRAIQEVNLM